MTTPLEALAAYNARGQKSLNDRALEGEIFLQIAALERTIDSIGPTPLRHSLSESIVEMRRKIWAFDQSKWENTL